MGVPDSKSPAPKLGGIGAIFLGLLVAQCSATPATVAAIHLCSATPFQTQISVRHLPARGGGRCDTKIFRGCSATPVLHLQNAIKSKNSCDTCSATGGTRNRVQLSWGLWSRHVWWRHEIIKKTISVFELIGYAHKTTHLK